MSDQRKTPVCFTFIAGGVIVTSLLLNAAKNDEAYSPRNNISIQDPEEGKKRAIAEGYSLRDKIYFLVDKDKNRVLDTKERRSLLDLLGQEKTFLNDTDTITLRPTKEGDGRLNIYLSQGFDGYVGTIPYSQVEIILDSKKK